MIMDDPFNGFVDALTKRKKPGGNVPTGLFLCRCIPLSIGRTIRLILYDRTVEGLLGATKIPVLQGEFAGSQCVTSRRHGKLVIPFGIPL